MDFNEIDYSWYNKKISKKKLWLSICKNALIITSVIVVLITIIFNSIFFSSEVVGISMQPTYNKDLEANVDANTSKYKDIVVCSRIKTAKPGDIVVLEVPEEIAKKEHMDNRVIIKRVIAVENQTLIIQFDTNTQQCYFFVDGEPLNDKYLDRKLANMGRLYFNRLSLLDNVFMPSSIQIEITLGKDEIFVLGDNRSVSCDSSIFGPLKRNTILGTVAFSYKYNEDFSSAFWKYVGSFF